VDLTDAEGSEQRVCFSDRIQVAGKEVSVEMVALTSANSLLISVKEAASTAAEILLRPDDLRRLAVSLGEWSDEGDADQEVSTLFDDRNFLRQLVTESNVVRVGMNCAGLADAFDESLLTCPNPRLETVIDVPAVVSGVSPDLPSFVQEAADENKLVGTVALLVQAYVENGVLSTLRHFQQQEAIQLNVAATMQQAASIDSEAEFNDRVERNLEAARTSKLRVRASTCTTAMDRFVDVVRAVPGDRYQGYRGRHGPRAHRFRMPRGDSCRQVLWRVRRPLRE
jgi:hypothetical protein